MNLLIAAAGNNTINLKHAIEHGADVNAFNIKDGNTALHFAAQNGNWRAVYFLLVHGAKPTKNFDQETPMHIACRYNHFNILALFQMAAAPNEPEAHNFSQFLTTEYRQATTP